MLRGLIADLGKGIFQHINAKLSVVVLAASGSRHLNDDAGWLVQCPDHGIETSDTLPDPLVYDANVNVAPNVAHFRLPCASVARAICRAGPAYLATIAAVWCPVTLAISASSHPAAANSAAAV